ncbi:MAG: hypothetical protein A2W90_02295 [Bacteroidetes bacterium GWF2_42_66]|nr:MAG: hypothetical protein A2W92_17085 [Bacteroidetes bacterium GWA2_42_15]OFY01181.1 MAG: hypothetical protein A2W89_15780 [Bacteroidetes bacterium GWE2_42_39]OFY42024.1 MAG: hypothetical protein A2W90_02295 [Bacteroidetes bacterium GWF2_42_66]HBL77775.1 hypothetical protein [Prolixibacteraceae bacterium]HCR89490.1 hypothetical protein [Prolixibacteraceae bacterium]
MENKISFEIPDEIIIQATAKMQEVITLLAPYLIALTPDERHGLPKMSDKTLPFVEKCLDYCVSDPQFTPVYLDRSGLVTDMKVYKQLTPLYRMVLQLEDNLSDTTMEAGAESYIASLSYYNSVKQAAKMSVPGSKPIYEDLSKRFVKVKGAGVPESNG